MLQVTGMLCRYGKSLFFLGWHEIRQTLYEAVPPEVVQFGRRYAGYTDEGPDGVVVRFQVAPCSSCLAFCETFLRKSTLPLCTVESLEPLNNIIMVY